jgi:hypothetical protein
VINRAAEEPGQRYALRDGIRARAENVRMNRGAFAVIGV